MHCVVLRALRANQPSSVKKAPDNTGALVLGSTRRSVVRDQWCGAPVEAVVDAALDHPNVGVVVTLQDRAGLYLWSCG